MKKDICQQNPVREGASPAPFGTPRYTQVHVGGRVIGYSKGKRTTAHNSVAFKPLMFGLNKDVSGSDVNEII